MEQGHLGRKTQGHLEQGHLEQGHSAMLSTAPAAAPSGAVFGKPNVAARPRRVFPARHRARPGDASWHGERLGTAQLPAPAGSRALEREKKERGEKNHPHGTVFVSQSSFFLKHSWLPSCRLPDWHRGWLGKAESPCLLCPWGRESRDGEEGEEEGEKGKGKQKKRKGRR